MGADAPHTGQHFIAWDLRQSPQFLMDLRGFDPLFEQAYAFGDNRPVISAIVVLGLPGGKKLAISLGLNPADPASLDAAPAREAALQRIRELTHAFPYYAQPRAVALTLEPWTPESTLLTPTLKLKRKNLAAHFAGVIDSLYSR